MAASNLEDIIQAVEALKKRYQKLIDEYVKINGIDDSEANKASKQISPELLNTLHAEIAAELTICKLFRKNNPQKASKPEFGLAELELNIMELALDKDPNQPTKLQNLAQLLFSLLDPSQKTQDNPITFLAKMRVFPRNTALVKVDASTGTLSKQTMELILNRVLKMCEVALFDAQNKKQQQTVDALRDKIDLVKQALKTLNVTVPEEAKNNSPKPRPSPYNVN